MYYEKSRCTRYRNVAQTKSDCQLEYVIAPDLSHNLIQQYFNLYKVLIVLIT